MKSKKGSISKKLGVSSEGPLTKKECLRKVRILRAGLMRKKYKGKLRSYAVYYACWYKWRSNTDRKAA